MSDPHASNSSAIVASMILLAATAAAVIVANSPLAPLYKGVLAYPLGFDLGPIRLDNTVKSWIKDALMAVFFLYVGLEIKYEFKEGALSHRASAALPFAGALGGIVVPALIYLAVAAGDPVAARGWAIPAATDIAFAVGVIGLLGKRVPANLKAFILAVAVIDDLAAILIIALFYTAAINVIALLASVAVTALLALLNWRNVTAVWPYMIGLVVLWVCLQQSGISATIAGVVAALCVPLWTADRTSSPLHGLMDRLRLPVLFLVMPLFAFAFAGVPLAGVTLDVLAGPITAGIWLGLMIGKPVGITLAVFLATRSGLARLPAGAGWLQIIGLGGIAGIGFTMSLFIGVLAFGDGPTLDNVRIGVLGGSISAALMGALLLVAAGRPAAQPVKGP